jgi:hypothetical protein
MFVIPLTRGNMHNLPHHRILFAYKLEKSKYSRFQDNNLIVFLLPSLKRCSILT